MMSAVYLTVAIKGLRTCTPAPYTNKADLIKSQCRVYMLITVLSYRRANFIHNFDMGTFAKNERTATNHPTNIIKYGVLHYS